MRGLPTMLVSLPKVCGDSQSHGGIREIHVIEDVVTFGTERDRVIFPDAETLHQGYVGVEVAGAAEGIASRVAEVAGGRGT